jgi:UDP-N-acetylenolpyruvoylglucosamine reductase
MFAEQNVHLQAHNTFGIVAKARELVRVTSVDDARAVAAEPALSAQPKFVLGGGSNIVLTGDVKPLVLKVEIMGRRLVEESAKGLGGGGRRRRELARLRGVDAGAGHSRAGKPGADPRHRGGCASAEHRRLRGRTARPF